jgi:hypothetical protein
MPAGKRCASWSKEVDCEKPTNNFVKPKKPIKIVITK